MKSAVRWSFISLVVAGLGSATVMPDAQEHEEFDTAFESELDPGFEGELDPGFEGELEAVIEDEPISGFDGAVSDADMAGEEDYFDGLGDLIDEDDWEFIEMTEDEDWNGEVGADYDYSDDFIAVDDEYDTDEWVWEAVALDENEQSASGDLGGYGDMPVYRRVRKSEARDDTPYGRAGVPVRDDAAPWQAQIYAPNAKPTITSDKRRLPDWQSKHRCGGTLIDRGWVLTAAHCIDGGAIEREGRRVRLGTNNIADSNAGADFQIDRFIRHSGYDGTNKRPSVRPNMYTHDIALVHLHDDGEPEDRSGLSPLPILRGNRGLPTGTPVSVVGWGRTENEINSARLMKFNLQVMGRERCRKLENYGPNRITNNVICASDDMQKTCRGDSGGALTLTNSGQLVGVVSWGKGNCTADNRPGVYTRIESYLGWIQEAMRQPAHVSAYP